jgi:glycosyltransferase involved in cell wall biosynthesis
VVATAVGGLPELVEAGESGLVVPPGDAEVFGRSVGRLLADAALSQRMGERARVLARERHDWSQIGRLTAELYRSVWQNGRAAPMTASAATGETAI